jgi:hypothetical protein
VDLYKAIGALHEERKRLDRLIESLERMHGLAALRPPSTRSRRGRKKMSAAERRAVSERMKKYWAARRRQKEDSASGGAMTPAPSYPS